MAKKADKKSKALVTSGRAYGVTTREGNRSVIVEQRSAPLPPPIEMEGFERVLRGSANRILTMTEENARHRRKVEWGNMLLSFVIVLLVVGLVAYALQRNIVWFASPVSIAVMLGLFASGSLKAHRD